jgi:Ca2+-binding EF-hand superfamily protein
VYVPEFNYLPPFVKVYEYNSTISESELRELFDSIDLDGDEGLDRREIMQLAAKMGASLSNAEVQRCTSQRTCSTELDRLYATVCARRSTRQ